MLVIAKAAAIWREMEPNKNDIAIQGLKFLEKNFAVVIFTFCLSIVMRIQETMKFKKQLQRIAVLSCVLSMSPAGLWAASDGAGYRSLFNGKDLLGWDGNPKFWSVRDGTITGQTTAENPTQGNTFLIWRLGTVEDFELHLSYRIVGGNSGIQYRSKDLGNWVVGGYQADY